jgi:hypothetical protein
MGIDDKKERRLAPDKLDVASTYDENREVIVRLRAGLLIVALVAVVAGRPTVLQAHHSEKETMPVGAKLTVEGHPAEGRGIGRHERRPRLFVHLRGRQEGRAR